MGSSNIQEAGIAMSKLKELLAAHGLSWNDLPAVLAAMGDASAEPATTPAAEPPRGPDLTAVNVLDLVDRLIEDHVTITAEERLAVVLWILHTHLFDQYAVSPRLALLSPVKGCGKTTLLSLFALLAHEPCRLDSVTAAWIYHQPAGTALFLSMRATIWA